MVQKNCVKNKILIICGPTASGKSDLAMYIADKLNTEIISADSMNVYKGLDIGTAKPSKLEREKIVHHLIDVVSPNQSFSVGDYKELAEPIVNRLISENRTPIVCGGTGFYVNSLIFNLSYGKANANLEIREKYYSLFNQFGAEHVYNVLKNLDPESALKINKNDVKRVIRALEIYHSGIKKSELNDLNTPVRNYSAYYVNYPRDILYERINLRVDKMIESGLIKEVESLIRCGLNEKSQCLQGIGYKEIYSYLKGEISLIEAINLIKINTRHYAKRQITFFKKLPNLLPLTPDKIEIMAERIINNL